MVCKKSEYRKQFRKPSWETHFEHYQEKVDYRSYRRLLEHRHSFAPWDWDSESSSGGSCNDVRPHTAPNLNNNGGGVSKQRKAAREAARHAESDSKRHAAQERVAPPTGHTGKGPSQAKAKGMVTGNKGRYYCYKFDNIYYNPINY